MRNSITPINSPDKFCPACEQTLLINHFRIRSHKRSYEAYCMDCTREKNRIYYRNNPYHAPTKFHPQKDKIRAHARSLFQSAVRYGKIERRPCTKCGAKAEGHHEDYLKPYDVVWLCKLHHGQAHWKPRAKAKELDR